MLRVAVRVGVHARDGVQEEGALIDCSISQFFFIEFKHTYTYYHTYLYLRLNILLL